MLRWQNVLDLVTSVSKFGCVHLKVAGKTTPAPMKQVLQLLHDNLIQHVEFESAAQDAICKLCEAWYAGDHEGKSSIVPQMVVTLLMRSVGDNARLSDVKRVWETREALTCIELTGPGARTVKESIMRAAIHPHFVMHDDGRRFLSYVLTLAPELTRAVHSSIKSQLPWCRATMLEQYGELYHAAWKKAAGPALHALEYDCFQDLANHCVHAATPALASALRKVLGVVHRHKKFKAVDEMLARVYEPVLWRALKVANPAVRRQAGLLFAEVFPVQDPDASNAEFEKSLNQQVNALELLMRDPVPEVREVGVQAVARVLSVYFDLLPVHTSTAFINLLVRDFAFDAASPAVRAAVVRGVTFILDNHLSHPLLATRLKSLGELMHDRSEKVRAAMADLLLKVRSVKTIRFFDVVPVDSLLARLAADAHRPAVVSRLVRLVMPSYLPPGKAPTEQLTRAIALMRQNPRAAEVFYTEAGAQAPAQAVVNLLVMLHHALLMCVQKRGGSPAAGGKGGRGSKGGKTGKRGKSVEEDAGAEAEAEALAALLEGDEEEAAEEDEALAALREAELEEARAREAEEKAAAAKRLAKTGKAAAGAGAGEDLEEVAEEMLVCMAAMARGLRARLEGREEKTLRKYLIESIPADSVPALVAAFPAPAARRAIWRLAAALPEPARGKDRDACLARLLAMPSGEAAGEAGPLVDCLVAWDAHKALLKSVVAGVAAALGADAGGAAGGKKKRRGEAAAEEAPAAWAEEGRAVWCAHYLFASDGARARLLHSATLLDPLAAALKGAMPVLERRFAAPAGEGGSPSDEVLLNALLLYAKSCLHAHCAEHPGTDGCGKAPQALLVLLKWCRLSAVPALAGGQPAPKRKGGKGAGKGGAGADAAGGAALAAGACRAALMVAAEAAALGRSDEALAAEALALVGDALGPGAEGALPGGLLQPACKTVPPPLPPVQSGHVPSIPPY
mgnify:CR=1 FL=1